VYGQIKEGLGGDVRSALKARVILRQLLGEITLCPKKDGSLYARYILNPSALVKGVVPLLIEGLQNIPNT
jgi:hypothetical protein